MTTLSDLSGSLVQLQWRRRVSHGPSCKQKLILTTLFLALLSGCTAPGGANEGAFADEFEELGEDISSDEAAEDGVNQDLADEELDDMALDEEPLDLAEPSADTQPSDVQSAETSSEPVPAPTEAAAENEFSDEFSDEFAADFSEEFQDDPQSGTDVDLPAPEPIPAQMAPSMQADIASPAPEAMSSIEDVANVDITDLRYVSKNGGTVVIETSAPATYRTREIPEQNQVVLEISNARLPERFKRPYITKDFRQEIVSINAYQDVGSTTARVVIQFQKPMSVAVSQSGRSLSVVPTTAIGASLAEATNLSPDQTARAATNPDSPQDSRILPTSSLDLSDTDAVRFFGRPISIEVRETPVRDVIQLIAEQSGSNIIVSDEVSGNVSLKLRQIPWDQALLLVMKSSGLGYVRQGTVLRVAPLAALQRETEDARRVIEAQRNSEPLKVKVIHVSYSDVQNLQGQLREFLSARGKVTADTRTASIVVTDIPENLERIANLVKALDTPPLQVLIEGKVVEASENFRRDFGINWRASGESIDVGDATMRTNLGISPGSVPQGASLGFRIGTLNILGDLDATLGLMETERLVKVVSSPRVVTMNNVKASVIQSTNISLQTTTIIEGQTVTDTQYTPVELRLEVKPQITSNGDVIMEVLIRRQFSAPVREGQTAPDINSREAATQVLVRNGQTAVIGGVYQSDSGTSEGGVPFLRNIPIVGWLFKSQTREDAKNELLVFLTPRILNAEKTLPKEGTL